MKILLKLQAKNFTIYKISNQDILTNYCFPTRLAVFVRSGVAVVKGTKIFIVSSFLVIFANNVLC